MKFFKLRFQDISFIISIIRDIIDLDLPYDSINIIEDIDGYYVINIEDDYYEN